MILGREASIFGDQRSTAGIAVGGVPLLLQRIGLRYMYSIPASRNQDFASQQWRYGPIAPPPPKQEFSETAK